MSRYAPGAREWFSGRIKARAMAIIAGLESLGWTNAEIADQMGYKSDSGYIKMRSGNGGTTKKKFRRLVDMERDHLAPKQDDLQATDGPTVHIQNAPIPTIKPPVILTFEQALENFNTALVLLVEAAHTLAEVTPPNLTNWGNSLYRTIQDLLRNFGAPETP